LTKERLVEIVQRLLTTDYKTEEEGDGLIAIIEQHNISSDWIFWPKPGKENLTAEEIVNQAIAAHKPILL
jgi:hypothetical protein